MATTMQEQLAALMRLPWTVKTEWNDDGKYFVARVVEVPSAIATAPDERSLAAAVWGSLEASLEVILECGDRVPLPPTVPDLPWNAARPRRNVASRLGGAAWEIGSSANTAVVRV